MRVLIWPASHENDATCQYRLLEPARCLQAQGADITVSRTGPTVLWSGWWDPALLSPPDDVRALGLHKAPDADVVVLQRPGRRWWADVIPFIQEAGVKVVVDVDDRFDRIHESNHAHDEFHLRNETMNYEWIDRACELADLVTVTTPSLLEAYGHGHGMVLPNLVPERYLRIKRLPRAQTIGWSGTVDTHPVDLQETGGAVGRVLQEWKEWRFHAVGTGEGLREALELPRKPTITGWVPFKDYAKAMAQMTLGIVPLEPSEFNDGKSSLKMSEMASVGVPVVASPTPDNLRMHALGIGFIAFNPPEWEQHLQALIRNRGLRDEISGRGREVMAGLTYERNCDQWWTAWTGKKMQMRRAS